MTVKFSDSDKIEAAAKCIRTMHEIAGCSVNEIKQLFHPDIIEAVVDICDKGMK